MISIKIPERRFIDYEWLHEWLIGQYGVAIDLRSINAPTLRWQDCEDDCRSHVCEMQIFIQLSEAAADKWLIVLH